MLLVKIVNFFKQLVLKLIIKIIKFVNILNGGNYIKK